MDNRLKNDYESLLRSLKDRYCRLLLVTGDSEQKAKTLAQIWDQDISPLQVSRALSAILVDASLSMRAQTVLDFFANFVNQSEILFLSDIEILFDRSLGIDPLMLLKNTARNRPMIVNWPGKIDFNANLLTYATPGHSEYFEAVLTDDILFWDESGRNSLNYEVTGGCHEI